MAVGKHKSTIVQFAGLRLSSVRQLLFSTPPDSNLGAFFNHFFASTMQVRDGMYTCNAQPSDDDPFDRAL